MVGISNLNTKFSYVILILHFFYALVNIASFYLTGWKIANYVKIDTVKVETPSTSTPFIEYINRIVYCLNLVSMIYVLGVISKNHTQIQKATDESAINDSDDGDEEDVRSSINAGDEESQDTEPPTITEESEKSRASEAKSNLGANLLPSASVLQDKFEQSS